MDDPKEFKTIQEPYKSAIDKAVFGVMDAVYEVWKAGAEFLPKTIELGDDNFVIHIRRRDDQDPTMEEYKKQVEEAEDPVWKSEIDHRPDFED